MNEAMTQLPTPEVAAFDPMSAEIANNGMLEAVMAMQNVDMASSTLMEDAAVAVGQANLATAGLTEEVNDAALMFQAQAAYAQEQAVRASVDALFSDDDEEELTKA